MGRKLKSRQSDSQTVRQSDNQTARQSDGQTVRRSDSQAVRLSDSQRVSHFLLEETWVLMGLVPKYSRKRNFR